MFFIIPCLNWHRYIISHLAQDFNMHLAQELCPIFIYLVQDYERSIKMSKEVPFNPTKYKNAFQKENYDRISITVPKGQKAIIQQYAKNQGKSLNSYIVDLIKKDMES